MIQRPIVVFSHGKEGDPRGAKIVAMSAVAQARGLRCESIDYRDLPDPTARVARLLDFCRSAPGPFVLVGSSLGGHVATAASTQVQTKGLFLLAPAFYMPGFEQYTPSPPACRIEIVHGWSDATVPVENSIRYGKAYRATVHAIDADHSLNAAIGTIAPLFDLHLAAVLA